MDIQNMGSNNLLVLYGILLLVAVLIILFIVYLFYNLKHKALIVNFDYSDKPKQEIIYYEILSSIIYQMRLRIGNDAIKMAQEIPNLDVNPKTGMVLLIGQNPAKIISSLVTNYEARLGKKLSFDLTK